MIGVRTLDRYVFGSWLRIFVLTALGLIGTVASVLGNEAAIRLGRRRLIGLAMLGSVVVGGSSGFVGAGWLCRWG